MGAKVIHFAGKADREIGTARCGIRLQGNVSTDDAARVTCEKCGAAPSEKKELHNKKERQLKIIIHGARAEGKTVFQKWLVEKLGNLDCSVRIFDEGVEINKIKTGCPAELMMTDQMMISIDTVTDLQDGIKTETRPIQVHLDFGPDIRCCEIAEGDSVTQNISAVTCLPCLRHKVRQEAERNNSLACAMAAANARSNQRLDQLNDAEIRADNLRDVIRRLAAVL